MDSHSLPTIKRMVDYLYTGNYSEKSNTKPEDSPVDTSILSLHVTMFALANKYDIKGLEILSANRYSKVLSQNQDVRDFLQSVPDVYRLTPDSCRVCVTGLSYLRETSSQRI